MCELITGLCICWMLMLTWRVRESVCGQSLCSYCISSVSGPTDKNIPLCEIHHHTVLLHTLLVLVLIFIEIHTVVHLLPFTEVKSGLCSLHPTHATVPMQCLFVISSIWRPAPTVYQSFSDGKQSEDLRLDNFSIETVLAFVLEGYLTEGKVIFREKCPFTGVISLG